MKRSFWVVVPLLALLVPLGAGAASLPSLAFTPSTSGAYDYGTIDPGQAASQTFTLTNSGGSASSALTIALSGSAAFTKTADSCTATSPGPKKSCSVIVQYAPASAGANESATLTAMSKKPNASASLALTGNGSTGPIPAHVTIDKVTVPAGDQQGFLFTSTLTGVPSFSLTDADTPKDVAVEPGTYVVTETLPAGWALTGISCSDGSSGSGATATVTVTSGQTVTCTFTNTKNT